MTDYAKFSLLRYRWVGQTMSLREVIGILKSDPNWHKAESYKTLMNALRPIVIETKEVERDLRGAPLSGADLLKARLSGADLLKANLAGTYLREANLSGTNLWETNLSGADLGEVLYTTDEIFNRLIKWWGPQILSHIPFLNLTKHFQNWKKVGVTNFGSIDTTKMNGSKNPILKRHIEDCQFIQGFRKESWFYRWIFYPLWKATSDCGRSLLLWLIWAVGLIGLFSGVYYHHRGDWFNPVHVSWFYAWYLSVIKFMTLGFGNMNPKIDHPTAQAWMMAEVVIGYVMFGGLISILINKLARRA